MEELRDKIERIIHSESYATNAQALRLSRAILAIPEIRDALKAYEFANVAVRSGRGVEPMPTDETFER